MTIEFLPLKIGLFIIEEIFIGLSLDIEALLFENSVTFSKLLLFNFIRFNCFSWRIVSSIASSRSWSHVLILFASWWIFSRLSTKQKCEDIPIICKSSICRNFDLIFKKSFEAKSDLIACMNTKRYEYFFIFNKDSNFSWSSSVLFCWINCYDI